MKQPSAHAHDDGETTKKSKKKAKTSSSSRKRTSSAVDADRDARDEAPPLVDALDDEVLCIVFASLPHPDRLRCEGVCKRWRHIMHTRREFTDDLVLPEDPQDDSPSTFEGVRSSAQGGWAPWREDARDDALTAAARKSKARGGLRRMNVSGCAEVTHGAVIDVLRTNPRLTHLVMDEGGGGPSNTTIFRGST